MKIKKKTVIGVLLIIVGLGALAFWEMYGRESIMYDEIIIAARHIDKGQILEADMLEKRPFARDAIVDGAIRDEDISSILGKVAKHEIPKNATISDRYLYDNDFYIKDGESVYEIKNAWINSISSSIRRGDLIGIYTKGGNTLVGRYKVAFVKDNAQREVTDAESKVEPEALERVTATSVINYIEIITGMAEYKKIYDLAQSGETFLVVQEGAAY